MRTAEVGEDNKKKGYLDGRRLYDILYQSTNNTKLNERKRGYIPGTPLLRNKTRDYMGVVDITTDRVSSVSYS